MSVESIIRLIALGKAGGDWAMNNFSGAAYDHLGDLPGPEEEMAFLTGTFVKSALKAMPKKGSAAESRALSRAIREAQARGEPFDPLAYKLQRRQAAEERYWEAQATPLEKAEREGDRQIRYRALGEVGQLHVSRETVGELFEAAHRLVTVRDQNGDGKYLYHSFYRNDLAREGQYAYTTAAHFQRQIVEYAHERQIAPFSKAIMEFLTTVQSKEDRLPLPADLLRLNNGLVMETGAHRSWLPEESEGYTVKAVQQTNNILHEQASNDDDKLTLQAASYVVEETLQFASTELWYDAS